MERLEILLTSFVKNYLSSGGAAMAASSMEGGDQTVLEAVIPGNHRYMATEKLWVDNATQKPAELKIYDTEGEERIVVTYVSFEYNVKLDDAVFTIQR